MDLRTLGPDELQFYKTLSPLGRKVIHRVAGWGKQIERSQKPAYGFLKEFFSDKKLFYYDCVLVSDKSFKKFIPDSYLKECKLPLEEAYYRLAKTSALLLSEHISFFKLFGIEPDYNSKERMAALAFLKRVYDDLLDEEKVEPEQLMVNYSEELASNKEYFLFEHLRGQIRKMAAKDKFPNYYGLLEKNHKLQSSKADLENFKELTFEKARNSFMLDTYLMMNDIPEEVMEARVISADFFACVEDYYDIEEDVGSGRITFINQSSNPEEALRQRYAAMENILWENAPYPDSYLSSMKGLSGYIISSRTSGDKKGKKAMFS